MRWPVVSMGMKATQLIKIEPAPRAVAPSFPEIGKPLKRKSRRQRKVARFFICETIAFAALVGFVVAGTSTRTAGDAFTGPFAVAVFIAAAALAIIPVVFFGLPQRHNQLRRYR